MFSFVAFLSATFAWILSMYALFTVSVAALVVSLLLYIRDRFEQRYRDNSKEKSA
ncbi:DUF3290 domain-containing protein [Vibrio vulnificus]|nr:DUF3290 domain-containing protein [Vibrio vulnificus]